MRRRRSWYSGFNKQHDEGSWKRASRMYRQLGGTNGDGINGRLFTKTKASLHTALYDFFTGLDSTHHSIPFTTKGTNNRVCCLTRRPKLSVCKLSRCFFLSFSGEGCFSSRAGLLCVYSEGFYHYYCAAALCFAFAFCCYCAKEEGTCLDHSSFFRACDLFI